MILASPAFSWATLLIEGARHFIEDNAFHQEITNECAT